MELGVRGAQVGPGVSLGYGRPSPANPILSTVGIEERVRATSPVLLSVSWRGTVSSIWNEVGQTTCPKYIPETLVPGKSASFLP